MIPAPDPEPVGAELAAEAEADRAHEWDDPGSAAYQARLDAGLEPEASL